MLIEQATLTKQDYGRSWKIQKNKQYLILVSIHGLICSHDLELCRDADIGGQTKYVVDLARALAAQEDVAQVDLITRRVVDPAGLRC